MSLEDSTPSSLDAAPDPSLTDLSEEGSGAEDSEEPAPRFAWKLAIAPPSEPEEVGPYRIEELLGQGAQGKVYRAHDPRTGRDVALKVLQRADEAARARFRREGQATAALNHPGIVRIHEAGEAEGSAYVAYELIEGAHDLKAILRSEPRPSPLAVAGWVAEIAAALGCAHAQGVVHRDLKPENVLVDPEGRLRVVDFGLARVRDATRLTESLASVGTPYYMSPEQIRGDKEVGPPADVWALGVLLYEGLTGGYPCRGANMVELGASVLSGQIEPPSARAPETPPALEEVCLRALRLEPDERYPDGQALAEALETALRVGFSAPPRRGSRLWWALPLGLLAALALLPLRTPTQRLTAPPSQEAFLRALQAEDWGAAESYARRSLQPAVWTARLEAERGRAAPDLELQLQAEGVPAARAAEVAALCSARAGFVRGGSPLPELRTGCARWPNRPQWTLARAEALLAAARPREALDLLLSAPSPAVGGAGQVEDLVADRLLNWCDRGRLQQALQDLFSDPPALAAPAWEGAPLAWRRGARVWLEREGLALEAWVARAREQPYLPRPPGDPTSRALTYLRAALALEATPRLRSGIAALDSGAAPPPGTCLEGTLEARGLRGAARGALARGAPGDALAFLARIQPSTLETPTWERDPWERLLRARYATAALRGRTYLALGDPGQAAAALAEADPRSASIQADLVQAAEAAGSSSLARERRALLRTLRGHERARAQREVARLRGTFRHGTAPLDQVEQALALDPLYDMAHATRATSRLLRGERGVEDMLLVGEAWPQHASSLHREVFSVWTEGVEFGHLRRQLLPGIRARSSPLGRAILAALAEEARGGDADAALAALDALEATLDEAPGLQAARTARALLLVRAGRLRAAEAELDWLEALQPRQAWSAFVRGLLIARQGARPREVVEALRRATRRGFKTFREPAWGPERYPELRLHLGAPSRPLERFLQSQGWNPKGGF